MGSLKKKTPKKRNQKETGKPVPGAQYITGPDDYNTKNHEYNAAIGQFSQSFEMALFFAKAFMERCFSVSGLSNKRLALRLMADIPAQQTINLIYDIYELTRPKDIEGLKDLKKLKDSFSNINQNRNTVIHCLRQPDQGGLWPGYARMVPQKKLFRGKNFQVENIPIENIQQNISYIEELSSILSLISTCVKDNKAFGNILKDFNRKLPPPIGKELGTPTRSAP